MASDFNPHHERLVQIGMRAVARDIQDWIKGHCFSPDYCDNVPCHCESVVLVEELKAYLLAVLITAGAYDDIHDAVA